MVGNYEDGQIEGLSRLAAAVHDSGGRVIPQLVHTGANANTDLFREGDELWGPSAVQPAAKQKGFPKEMTVGDITRLIEAYAAAAERSKKAGFDGVQLHGAHGYGINQFLSPKWNVRGDGYGGSLKNRYRFLAETLEAVRGAVGGDFPVTIKLNGSDFVEGGLEPEESVKIAERLADDGIDMIEVSGGSALSPKEKTPARMKIRTEEDEAYLVDLAARVKERVGVPVATVGGIRSLKVADDILAAGKADLIAMSRPLIREPGLINRWESGDTARATCISCNGCFESGLKGEGISCKVDRQLREKED
jgi:2,4-dienoyl-CoA reductase-like NADH-dependent reductase (Old Yellow Enzyme family)